MNVEQRTRLEVEYRLRVARPLARTACRLVGHQAQKGSNGWENFGSGVFCRRCSQMLSADGQRALSEREQMALLEHS